MKIAIVGLGGVGGYICAMLSKNTSHDIVGFARGSHLQKIQQNSLTIVEDEISWNVAIKAKNLDEASGYFDIVIFCVKSYDLENSYNLIKNNIANNSILLSLSNGVDNGDILRDISDANVLDGCVYILSHIQEDGVIRKKGNVFALVFGGEKASILEDVIKEAGLRYKIPSDIKTAIWKKYMFISTFATLTSYYDKPIGYIYENHKDEATELLNEIAKFAFEKGVNIKDEIQKALKTASNIPYDSDTSMHLDFKNNKKTEVDSLTGYIDKPLMRKMYKSLIKN